MWNLKHEYPEGKVVWGSLSAKTKNDVIKRDGENGESGYIWIRVLFQHSCDDCNMIMMTLIVLVILMMIEGTMIMILIKMVMVKVIMEF